MTDSSGIGSFFIPAERLGSENVLVENDTEEPHHVVHAVTALLKGC